MPGMRWWRGVFALAAGIVLVPLDVAFAQCTFSVSPATVSIPALGATGSIAVTASASTCDWTASSDGSWVPLTTASAGGYDSVVKADGAEAYWRLNEQPGTTTAADATGHGHSGTYVSMFLGQPGVVPGDTAVAATSGYIDLGTTAPALGASGAIELWVKPYAGGTWYQTYPDARVSVSGDSVYRATLGNGSMSMSIASNAALALNTWTHVVVTWNGTYWWIFLNGVYDNSGWQTVNPSTAGIRTLIGYPTSGSIDEVAVYNTSLSAAQIAAHYAAHTKTSAGNGTVTYTVGENTTGAARSATLTIAGQTVTVNQADPCTIAANTNYVAGSGSGTVTVTGTNACHWTATSNASWISLPTDTSRYAAQVLADGPDAYWRLNESSGSTIADSSGHSYDGTRYWSFTSYGQIGAVNGDTAISGYPVVTFPATPAMTTTGTVEVWVKPTGGDLDWYSRWYGGGAVQDRRIRLYSISTDRRIHASFSNGTAAQTDIVSASDLPLNSWSHVALAWNGSTWSLYLNGVSSGSGWQTVVPFTALVPSYIGQPIYGIGSVDELAIYQTPLTQQQAANHYALASGAAYTGTGSVTISLTANPTTSPRSGTVTIGSQTVTITQDGQPLPCSYALSVPSVTLDAAGGTGSVALTTAASCGWTATSNASWLTVSPTSGASSASIGYVATNNTTAASRTATITVEGQTTTVTQTPCGFTFTPTSLSLGAGSSSGSLAIAAPSTCGWTATSADPWITLYPGIGRYSDQVIADGASAYWRFDESSGTAVADGSLNGFTGTYLSPASTSFGQVGAIAGDTAIGGYSQVSLPSTPPMTTTGTVELWIKPIGLASQWYTRWYGGPSPVDQRIALFTQDGDSKLHAAFSDGTNTQRDIASISDLPLNVWTHVAFTWNGSSWSLYLNGASNASGPQTVVPFTSGVPSYVGGPSPHAIGGADELALYTVALTAQQVAQHYSVGSGVAPSGTGNGTVLYTATANPSSLGRSTTITAGSQALTVAQTGAPCTYALSASSLTLDGEAHSGTITVTTPGACTWTAGSADAWVTLSPGTGDSTTAIPYSVAANAGADRTTTLSIAGLTVSVLQRAPCAYSINPTSMTVPSYAGVSTMSVTSSASTCQWTAGTSTPWMTMEAYGGYAGAVLGDQPVGYWRLGETSPGMPAHDSAGTSDGTYVGSTLTLGSSSLVAGTNTAVLFGGTSYVNVGTPHGGDQRGSVELWLQPSGKGVWFSRNNGDHWENQVVVVFNDPADLKYHVAFADGGLSQHDIVSASDMAMNATTHLVVTWDRTTWSIYLNGALDATGVLTVAPRATVETWIGGSRGMPYGYAHGVIDDVALYASALTAAQVAAHYAARTALPLFGSGVLAYRTTANVSLASRTGAIDVEDDAVPVAQLGVSPHVLVNGIAAPATASVVPGQIIQPRVHDGPGNARDWLGLFPVGADDAVGPLAWAYLSGSTDPLSVGVTTATISLVMPAVPGTYEVRFFWNDTLFKLATSGPVVVGGPAVTLTSPAANAAIGAGETMTLAASASDYGPGITRVDFAVNGNVVASATAPPWTGAWGTATDGTYALTATATDASGFTATSSAVTVTVGVGGSAGSSGGGSGGGGGGGGTSCAYSVSPPYILLGSGGASQAVTVTAPAGCPSAMAAHESWVNVDVSQGSGTWTATITVGANPSSTGRVTTMQLAGTSVIVEQNGAGDDSGFEAVGSTPADGDNSHTVFFWSVSPDSGAVVGIVVTGPGTPRPPPIPGGGGTPPGQGCEALPMPGHFSPYSRGCSGPEPGGGDGGGGEPDPDDGEVFDTDDDRNIDINVIVRNEGRNRLEAYVPRAGSGVTVCAGYDIGKHSDAELRALQLSQTLYEAIRPFADNTINPNPNGLRLSTAQCNELNGRAFDQYFDEVEDRFNYEGGPESFGNLPWQAQTILADLYYNTKTGLFNTNLWQQVLTSQWCAAYQNLMNYTNVDPTLRQRAQTDALYMWPLAGPSCPR